MIEQKRIQWVAALSLLLASLLACGIGPKKADMPKPPEGHIAPKEEASQRVKANLNQSLQEATGKYEARFRITNEEITSIVADALQQRADIPFSEPQIWFTAGKMYVTGKIEGVGPTSLPALIVAIPKVNDKGQLEIEIEKAQMSNFDFPDSVIESLTQTANETLADLQLDIQITAIEVLEGEMIVAGKRVGE